MSLFLVGLGCFIMGAAFGYAYCRHLLHSICKEEVGPYKTANIFGYPEPPKPTIAELEAILREENK